MRGRSTFPQLRYHEILAGEEHGHQIYLPELNLAIVGVRIARKTDQNREAPNFGKHIDNGNGDQPHKAGKKDRKSDEYVFPLFLLSAPRVSVCCCFLVWLFAF